MKAVVASLATAAVLVGAAYAGNVTPLQLSKLNARVTALQKSETALESYVTTCLHGYVGITQYGGNDATTGYVFQIEGAPQDTTALDLTQSTDSDQYRVAAFSKGCNVTRVPGAR